MRFYLVENPMVESLINVFNEKMQEFLDEHEELKLIIQEFRLSFNEETILQDEQKKPVFLSFYLKME